MQRDYGNCSMCNKALTRKQNRFCCQKCFLQSIQLKPREIKICPRCQTPHEKEGTFCSRSCASSGRKGTGPKTGAQKLRTCSICGKDEIVSQMNTTKEFKCSSCFTPWIPPFYEVTCAICSKVFRSQGRKTCSKDCFRKIRSQEALKQLNKGRGKNGWYRGIHCNSTWELAYIIWHLDHEIPIKRCTQNFNYSWKGQIRRYNPDFIVDNHIVEIKGYLDDLAKAKLAAAKACGVEIELLQQKEIQPFIDYVFEKYKPNQLEDLFEIG